MGGCMQTPQGQVTRISCESGSKGKGATTNQSAEGNIRPLTGREVRLWHPLSKPRASAGVGPGRESLTARAFGGEH